MCIRDRVKRGLSAGRVQSVALRMICDREDEINAFIPEEYWNLEADLLLKGNKKPLAAKYYGTRDSKGGKTVIRNKEELDQILSQLEAVSYTHLDVYKRQVLKRARYFITCKGRMMEGTRLDQDYITSCLVGDERRKAWDIENRDSFRQLTLFDDMHLEMPVTSEMCIRDSLLRTYRVQG